ncbi:MAG: DUF2304 domain-containing protein [Candidatus Omnitrophica bacterium]|nr:DUF2304 domain-containing protein [Candidatus Omnitrophota bacterium]
MIVVLQFIGVAFALVMIYFALLNYRRGELNATEIFLWFIIWVAAIIVVVFPDFLRVFSSTFLFARLFDLLVVGALLVVVVMVSRAYIATKRMERKLEKYVRKEALKNVKEKKK